MDPRLTLNVVTPLPDSVAVGGGSALFVDGSCLLDGQPPEQLELVADGHAVPLMGWGVPPPKSRTGNDYWWGILPLDPVSEPAAVRLEIRARGADGEPLTRLIGELKVVPRLLGPEGIDQARATAVSAALDEPGEGPLIAICLAAFDPDPELLRRQLESIRLQTHQRWVCLISDDGSSRRGAAAIAEALPDDDRFLVSAAPRNRGFYANFERALTMVPQEAEFVALCDQDDHWHPDKLEALLAGLEPEAAMVYSDMRIVARDGVEISETYWGFRSNNFSDFGSLVLANTVTGAASLFRAELLEDALPFPPRHSNSYHDHWIAQVAMTLGPISYVDRPLYDYVQHDAATIGHLAANGEGRYSASLVNRARITWGRLRGRRYHLGWRQPYFNVWCRTVLTARVLQRRCGERMAPDRAAVLATLLEPRAARRWLMRRAAAAGIHNTETLGRERVILAGLAWEAVRLAAPAAPFQRWLGRRAG